jgi:hypothetical protein
MNRIKQFLLSVALLLVGTVASAQSCVTTNDVTTCHYTIPDDGHAIVPIPFGFPFYGHIFTHSIFFDNGAVSFYSPTMPQRWGPSWPGGLNINNNTPSSFFYSIIPLGTDLIANGGTHFTQGNENFLTYNWNNVSQFGYWNSRNTFSVEIRPTGFIGINYDRIEIVGGWVSGIIGDASLDEYTTFNSTTSWSINDTFVLDCSNPLNDSSCPGYDVAYFNLQCSISALYSPGCPGYSLAFLTYYNIGQSTPEETENEIVEDIVIETSTSTSPVEGATEAVSLTNQPTPTPQPAPAATTRTEPATRPALTTRQALAQRRAAQAAQRARDNPEGTSEAMDSADSMEQQVELQNAVLGAMSFVPGFDAYGRVTLPDAPGYAPFEIYSGQRNVDTPAARGLLGRSDRLHQEMIDAQYR